MRINKIMLYIYIIYINMVNLSVLKHPIILPVISATITIIAMFVYNKRTKDKEIDNKAKYIVGTIYITVLIGINLFVYNKFFCITKSNNTRTNQSKGNILRSRNLNKPKQQSFTDDVLDNKIDLQDSFDDIHTSLKPSTDVDISMPDF